MKNKNISFIDSAFDRLLKKQISNENKYILKVYLLKYAPILLSFAFLGVIKGLIFSAIWWLFITMIYDHRDIVLFKPTIRVWFGVPGSGKTSMGAWLANFSLKNGYKVLSNVEIDNTYKVEESDLGNYDMSFDGEGCHLIYDEANINGLDNRGYKDFAKTNKPLYFSIHRHMNNRVDVFSQGYDIDKRIRDRAGTNSLFYLKRVPFKGWIMYRTISKVLFIKKDDKQMIDGFEFRGLPRFVRVKSVWNSFDTLDMSLCPKTQKEWHLWNEKEVEWYDL